LKLFPKLQQQLVSHYQDQIVFVHLGIKTHLIITMIVLGSVKQAAAGALEKVSSAVSNLDDKDK
jgi:hypothetical protein